MPRSRFPKAPAGSTTTTPRRPSRSTTWPSRRATRGTTTLGFTVTALGGERSDGDRRLRHRRRDGDDGGRRLRRRIRTPDSCSRGITTLPVNVTVNGDAKAEANETVLVNLTAACQRHDPGRPGHRHDQQRRRGDLPADRQHRRPGLGLGHLVSARDRLRRGLHRKLRRGNRRHADGRPGAVVDVRGAGAAAAAAGRASCAS